MNACLPFAADHPPQSLHDAPPPRAGRRYLAISLPRLPTDRIARMRWGAAWRLTARPDAPPLVIAGKRDNAMRLTALNEPAAGLGLVRGQPLTDARAMCPAIEVLAEDPAADRLLVDAIADWCDRYTPLVAVENAASPLAPATTARDYGLMLDITGCSGLFGGEKALLDDLLARLFHQGFLATAAIAATPGAAWAVSRFDPAALHAVPAGQDAARFIIPAAATGAALEYLPLAALRLDTETLSGLARIGLHLVGQVMARPRAPLARRFGKLLMLRLDQALGTVEEAISPRLPVPELIAERRLAEPVGRIEDIEFLIHRLAGHLCESLEKRGQGARIVDLVLFRADGNVLRAGVGTSRPVRDASAFLRLFRERLAALHDDFDPGLGFDMVRLSVSAAEALKESEPGFLSGEGDPRPVMDLVDRLGARLGIANVLQGIGMDTHLPERAEMLVPAAQHAAKSATGRLPGPQTGPGGNGLPPLRPLRLFACPEPVEAIARIPDGPPVRFRWRRVLHEILRAEGPERIADEWWARADTRMTRDYYRVEDHDGHRYWLFREGLYGTESDSPRWFVHGLFA